MRPLADKTSPSAPQLKREDAGDVLVDRAATATVLDRAHPFVVMHLSRPRAWLRSNP
jgi:hypothetical protein